jgi:hypothetical protein
MAEIGLTMHRHIGILSFEELQGEESFYLRYMGRWHCTIEKGQSLMRKNVLNDGTTSTHANKESIGHTLTNELTERNANQWSSSDLNGNVAVLSSSCKVQWRRSEFIYVSEQSHSTVVARLSLCISTSTMQLETEVWEPLAWRFEVWTFPVPGGRNWAVCVAVIEQDIVPHQ